MALSLIILSFGCASGSPSSAAPGDGTASLWSPRPERPGRGNRRDAGELTDAAATIVDSGSTTPPAPDDAGVIIATDAGSTTAPDAGSTALDAGSPTTGAWRPFSATSPWNMRIPATVALRPDSAQLVEHLRASTPWAGIGVNIEPWGIPVFRATASTPLVRVFATLSNEGQSHTFYWPVPTGATPDRESDGHMLIIDPASGREYDFYQGRRSADGTWTCSLCSTADMSGSGVRPPKGGGTPWYESHGSRACGFPLAAGLITVDEMRAGRIDHALAIAYPGIRQRWFRSPASTGHPANGIVSPDRGIPCGGRIQLDPSLDLDSLGLSPSARIIARALQEYGAYVGDYSGSISLYADGSPDARTAWSSGLLSGGDARAIPIERLRVIEWGTLLSDG